MKIQMRPPADADNFRVKAGRFGDRFYCDPLPADDHWDEDREDAVYPAISTVKKAVGQDWTRAALKRLAKEPSQLVEIGGLDSEFERKERLNILSEAGLGQASGRGTIVHAHAEAKLFDRIPIYQMDEVVKPYIAQLERFFAAYQPGLFAAEFVAIHRTLNAGPNHDYIGYGGTGDAVVEIDGKLYLVDWKSRSEDSDHKAYSEEAGQVSAYGRADYWIIGDDTSPTGCRRIEPPDLEGGLIVSIKPDSYECFPIDLDAGFDYWTDLHAWWQARRHERGPVKRKWAPRADVTDAEVPTVSEGEHDETTSQLAPTPASNKERFLKLPKVKQGWARESFKRRGLNPNDPATAGEVSRIIGDAEHTPDLREMQEKRVEQEAEHKPEPEMPAEPVDPFAAEGGEASESLVAEARLMFDMVIGEHGRDWTGHRVKEANASGVSFRMSDLRSMKRAHLYLALCNWARMRGEELVNDEAEGNIEFASLLFSIDNCEDGSVDIGTRLGGLTPEEAEMFATEVAEVVQSELGDQPVTETEAQPV